MSYRCSTIKWYYIALETAQHLLWLVHHVLSLRYDDQFCWLLTNVNMLLRVITHYPQNHHVWNLMQTTHAMSTIRPHNSKKFPSCTNDGHITWNVPMEVTWHVPEDVTWNVLMDVTWNVLVDVTWNVLMDVTWNILMDVTWNVPMDVTW